MSPRAGPGDDRSIAIVGLAGRFPGARDVEDFWRNLCEGVESIRRFSDEELAAAGVPEEHFRDPRYVPARAVLDEPDCFDARFFGYAPREAELMDPQQPLFLGGLGGAERLATTRAPRAPVGVFAAPA
jgi:acyl transferase domain-containing protein